MRPLNGPEILTRAWQLAWHRRRAWFDMALIPLIWSLLLDVTLLPSPERIMTLDPSDPAAGGEVMSFFGSVVLYLALSLVAWSMFASAWLRACLDAPPVSRLPVGLSLTARDGRVLGVVVRLFLIFIAVLSLVLMILGAGALARGNLTPATLSYLGILSFLVAAPILARASLALPAAAMGEPARIGDSWRRTAGNAFRLFVLLLGVVVAIYLARYLAGTILASLLQGIFGAPLTLGPRVVLLLGINFLSFAASALTLAVLAISYRQLGGGGLQVVPKDRDGV